MSNLISLWQFIVGATYVVFAIYVVALAIVIYCLIKHVIARFTVENYITKNINLRKVVKYFSKTNQDGLFYNKSAYENYVVYCVACYVDAYIHGDDEVCDRWTFRTTDTFKCVECILSKKRYDRVFNEIWRSFIREYDDSDIYSLTEKIENSIPSEKKKVSVKSSDEDISIINEDSNIPADILRALTEDDTEMIYSSHKKEAPKGVNVLDAINDTYN